MVCPHVKAWEEDFKEFDEFVRTGIRQHNNDTTHNMQHVTLVAFHPSFCRWYGLPQGFGVGSVVDSYYGTIGQKSKQTTPATIIETNNKAFGLRKVKVRFHDTTLEGLCNRQEHYVLAVNEYFNKHWATLQKHPKLLWQLLCMCNYDAETVFFHEWIGYKKKNGETKSFKLLQELYPNKKTDELELMTKLYTTKELKALAEAQCWDDKKIAKYF